MKSLQISDHQLLRQTDSEVLRSKPVKLRSQAPIVKTAKLCESLPSLTIEKHKRAHPKSEREKYYYNLEGLGKVWSLTQLYEIHLRMGQFLQGEAQPDFSKRT